MLGRVRFVVARGLSACAVAIAVLHGDSTALSSRPPPGLLLSTTRAHVLVAAPGPELGAPVAIHPVGPDLFLLADYANVFLFDAAGGELAPMQLDTGGAATRFEPTSFASNASGRIWIANYRGDDVLEVDLDRAGRRLILRRRIHDPRMKSPEGVAVEGDLLATANYDGSNVQVFRMTPDGTTKLCDLEVPAAHGVAFVHGALFATSLHKRKIYKIDPVRCTMVGETGGNGWDAGRFLWPTTVAKCGEASIVVADAHTGLVSMLDAATLRLQRVLGGNGPGRNGLNMPYAAAEQGGALWVLSTFGRRIFRVDAATGAADVWDRSAQDQWQESVNFRFFLNAMNYDGYTLRGNDLVTGERCWRADYARLAPCARRGEAVRVPGYFVQHVAVTGGWILISPQFADAFFFDGHALAPASMPIGLDHWIVAGKIIGPRGVIEPDELRRRFGAQ